MKLNYKFGEGIEFDGEASELVAAVGQFDGLKSLAQTNTNGYIEFVREAIQLGHHYQDPNLTKMILNSKEPIAALPPASAPAHIPQQTAYAVPGYDHYAQQPAQPAPQPHPQNYYQQAQAQPNYGGIDPYANPMFNPVETTITTQAETVANSGHLIPYQQPAVQAASTSVYQRLTNTIDWALLKQPRIFPIYMSALVIILVVGVLTSPLRKQIVPIPAPSPAPAQPVQPPKQTAPPAQPPKGGTGTPPVEPPSM